MWKENRQHANAVLHRLGLATFTVDMPGVGEHPLKFIDPRAERTYSAAIDHLASRTGHRRQPHRRLGRQLRRLLGGAARLHGSEAHQGRGLPRQQRALRVPARVAHARAHQDGVHLSLRAGEPVRSAQLGDGREDAGGIPRGRAEALVEGHGAARQAIGGDPGRQRQARRPGAGAGHLSPDGARQSQGSAHLPRRRPHGPHAGRDASEITETICAWLKSRI